MPKDSYLIWCKIEDSLDTHTCAKIHTNADTDNCTHIIQKYRIFGFIPIPIQNWTLKTIQIPLQVIAPLRIFVWIQNCSVLFWLLFLLLKMTPSFLYDFFYPSSPFLEVFQISPLPVLPPPLSWASHSSSLFQQWSVKCEVPILSQTINLRSRPTTGDISPTNDRLL